MQPRQHLLKNGVLSPGEAEIEGNKTEARIINDNLLPANERMTAQPSSAGSWIHTVTLSFDRCINAF